MADQIIAAERVRTAAPPLPQAVEPLPPPPPPDPALVEASRKAEEKVVAEAAARAVAKGPQIVGRSYTDIASENAIVVRRRALAQAEMEDILNARMEAGRKAAEQRAAAQKEATALLAAMEARKAEENPADQP
jgi:hypothetical protein